MITALRNQLLVDLQVIEDIQVSRDFERVNAPAVIVRPAVSGTYVDVPDDQRFQRSYRVHVDVFAAVRNGENALEALEDLIVKVLDNSYPWRLDGVDSVGLINLQGTDYPGAAIHLSRVNAMDEE